MEKMKIELISNEINPEALGKKFNDEDSGDFMAGLRQRVKSNPLIRFTIVADWAGVQKAQFAKAILDQYAIRLNIDSITIRATRQQYEEDVNAFESGVKWEEIKQ